MEKLFVHVDGDLRTIVDKLLDKTAFLLAQSDELEERLKAEGSMEFYKNGAQEMWREHPASKIHTNVSKNLLMHLMKMKELIPTDTPEKDELDKLMEKKKRDKQKKE